MAKKNNNQLIGRWSFIIGIVIAVLAALIPGYTEIVMLVLFILGLLVGFLNITRENAIKFLLALTTLLVMGVAVLNALDVIQLVNDYLKTILSNFVTFIAAAGLVVAIKAVLETSKK